MNHKVEASRPKLIVRMTTRVDDLNIIFVTEYVTAGLQHIDKVFGKWNIDLHQVTNRGARHRQDGRTKAVTLDQHENAASLRSTAHDELFRLAQHSP